MRPPPPSTRRDTLIAELLPPPQFDDENLGTWFSQYDEQGRTAPGSVTLATQQPAGIGLYRSHTIADTTPDGTSMGTLRYIERDGWGAIWGVFDVDRGFNVADLAGADRISIGYRGRRTKRADFNAADWPLARGGIRGATLEHVACTDSPASRSQRAVAAVPVDVLDDPRLLGLPVALGRPHRELIRRAVEWIDQRRYQRSTDPGLTIIDSQNYIANQHRRDTVETDATTQRADAHGPLTYDGETRRLPDGSYHARRFTGHVTAVR